MRPGALTVRLLLIVAAGLLAMQVLAAVFLVRERARDTDTGFRFPLPDQASAIVELLEAAPVADRTLVLRAVNSEELRVVIVDEPPKPDEAGGERRLPSVERAVRAYLEALGNRPVTAMVAPDAGADDGIDLRLDPSGLWTRSHFRLVVGLAGGGYAVIETHGDLVRRIFGWPAGLFAGFVSLAIAAAALWAVWRETRPLGRLAAAAERFGRDAEPAPVRETGAGELRLLIAAFNRMQTRIAELLRGRTLMLGAISHDLRTYLTRLRLRAEFIVDDDQRARAARDIDEMKALVDDALAFVRTEAEAPAGDAVDLAELVRDVCAARRADGAAVTLLPADGDRRVAPMIVAGNRTALGRVVANIVDNAIKYTGAAEVELVAAGETGGAEVRVHDRGPGIPAAERERVLEPFYRLEASRSRDTGGSGLGLAIAGQIMQRHGGRLVLADRPGGGLTARLLFPPAAAAPTG